MGMHSFVQGIKPPDKRWLAMKKIWDACEELKVNVPEAVQDFFDGDAPDELGVVIDMTEHNGVTDYKAEGCDGFEVDLTKLPKDITIIRFVNSY